MFVPPAITRAGTAQRAIPTITLNSYGDESLGYFRSSLWDFSQGSLLFLTLCRADDELNLFQKKQNQTNCAHTLAIGLRQRRSTYWKRLAKLNR